MCIRDRNIATRVTDDAGDVVRSFSPRVLRDLQIPEEFHGPIERGLLDVTMRPAPNGGTAYRVFSAVEFNLWNWPVAGKTGTAEVDDKADTSIFAAYGPAFRTNALVPADVEAEVAIAVVLEESGFGSSAAAPVAAAILDRIARDEVPVARSLDETTRYALGLVAEREPAVGADR